MSDPRFHELLGDDGEFLEPVDTRYGVYSHLPRRAIWGVYALMGSAFVCALIGLGVWFTG